MTNESNPSSHPKSRDEESRRSVARTAADVAIGGTALAADKAIEAAGEVVERATEALGRGRREVEDATEKAEEVAQRVRRMARDVVEEPGVDGRVYEDRTRAELYELAAERDIAGRSTMRKAELINALRAHH